MRHVIAVFTVCAALALTGCGSAAAIQRQCAESTHSFPAQASCIEAEVARDPGLRGDPFIEEYVLSGKVLAEKVVAGEMTDTEAQLEFARAYNRLLTEQQRYRAYNAIEMDRIRPRHTVCHPDSGGRVSCDTY